MSHSSKAAGPRKPEKPRPDFPLFAHANGQWAKKVRGKLHYFGSWNDPDRALNLWLDQRDDLLAGRQPRMNRDGLTIAELCNRFLTDRKHRLDAGDIVLRTFQDYHDACEKLIAGLSGNRLIEDLRPEDFTALRAKMAKRVGPVRLGNEINRIRGIFRFALEADLVERPVKFGPTFDRPSQRVLRQARHAKGPRMFEAAELRQLIDTASQPLKSMILLGANCGLGNHDCAMLPMDALDLDGGWIDYPRPKTGIMRRCPLWPETIDALREVLAERKEPTSDAHKGLVFVTKYGNAWVSDKDPSVIGKEVRKLLDSLELHRPGLGFYALRHTFETVGGDTRDQVAVNHIMGHADGSMASHYRERIEDDRLRAVTDHVRGWLFGKAVQ